MKTVHSILFSLFVLVFSQTAFSAESNIRSKKNIGVYTTVMGGPFYMGHLGINFLRGLFRINAGYGKKTVPILAGGETFTANITVAAAGARLLVPGWNVSPFIGADYMTGSATVDVLGTTVSASVKGISSTGGVDYTSDGGINMGILVFVGKISGSGGYVGIYF